MPSAVIDLLPRDAELARRAAGGDGAAFVRLYDHYSDEVFAAALSVNGSVEEAADATQTAFLRILRWPPALGAPDGDVLELLYALALGGPRRPGEASALVADLEVARLVGVGWLRSETVSKAGARFDADWSVHLWAAPAERAEPAPARSRRRLRLLPSPAAAAAVLLILLAGLAGTLLIGGGSSQGEPEKSADAARSETAKPLRLEP